MWRIVHALIHQRTRTVTRPEMPRDDSGRSGCRAQPGLQRPQSGGSSPIASYLSGRISGVSDSGYPVRQPRTDEEWEAFWAYFDVRPVLAEMRVAGEPDLGRVEWGRFHHWHGPADDVPGLLEAVAGPDPQAALVALRRLSGQLVHQRCTSGPAALAVPFLLRIAARATTHHRASVLSLAARAGHRVNFVVETRSTLFRVGNLPGEVRIAASGERSDWCLQAAREALGADAAILIELLDDTDPDVRIEAAFALATAVDLPPAAEDAMRSRLTVENDQAVRISLVLAVEQLSEGVGEAEQWWRDATQPDDIRFAAALAWLCLTDLPAPADLTGLLAQLTTPEMERTVLRVPWSDHDLQTGLAGWLNGLLDNTPL